MFDICQDMGWQPGLCYVVLDEADTILEHSFMTTMNAIIENLPKQRQTLLFSATQTKYLFDFTFKSYENLVLNI